MCNSLIIFHVYKYFFWILKSSIWIVYLLHFLNSCISFAFILLSKVTNYVPNTKIMGNYAYILKKGIEIVTYLMLKYIHTKYVHPFEQNCKIPKWEIAFYQQQCMTIPMVHIYKAEQGLNYLLRKNIKL